MVKPEASGSSSLKKKTKGKKKIDLKKIQEPNSRKATFTKRRIGLFKQAAEICILTGAEIGILVNSPGGQIFSFGHPNADDIFDRYLDNDNNNAASTNTTGADSETIKNQNQNPPPPLPKKEFNQHYEEVSRELLDAEMKREETIPVNSGGLRWYDEPVDGMNVEELQEYLCSLEELKKKVMTRADEMMTINNSSAIIGSNVSEMGRNNSIDHQPMYTPTKAADDGGFHVQDAGDGGNI
ncbi:hypothetical protein L1887_18916 [Cichorium endivia]|nr:hypothetical protein L1887_18916 [Cichorium endivia]